MPLVLPASAAEALSMVLAGLGWLAGADAASLTGAERAECLRGLERALSAHTAARSKVLAAFTARADFEDDGHGSPRTWLKWQTRVTGQAASAAIGWSRRLKEHPAAAAALAAGDVSASWARCICDWTDALPQDARSDADVILVAAAQGGARLEDLADLARQIRSRTARPDKDDDGFGDRALRLATTLGGAGRMAGDLTPGCAAAVRAVLDALGKRAGPEDTRTKAQRDHDALQEAMRRLIAAGCLPGRAGQPLQIQVHMTLAELLGDPGRNGDEDDGGNALPWPAAAPGDDCDAAIAPVVTGRIDHELLDHLATRLTSGSGPGGGPGSGPGGGAPWWAHDPVAASASQARDSRGRQDCPCGGPGCHGRKCDGTAIRAACLNWAAARHLILTHAIELLSGPGGLASWLRTRTLPRPAGSVSLPLDVGAVTDTIPPHLRRAVILRDRHCAAPGCDQPPAACHIHHITPRSKGGTTKLTNLLLLCPFHHLILIHRWGWHIRLNPDGTTTATSPDGRTLHSHSPPPASAA